MVQIVAIVTAIAFVGLFPIVILASLGIGPFQGGANDTSLVDEAQDAVDANPQDPEAWEQLASAYVGEEDLARAVEAAQKAYQLDPGTYGRVSNLVTLQNEAGQTQQAIVVLRKYTARKDADPEAFLLLAQEAETVGNTNLARLSYLRYLQLEPDSPNKAAVQDRLDQLAGGGVATTAP